MKLKLYLTKNVKIGTIYFKTLEKISDGKVYDIDERLEF